MAGYYRILLVEYSWRHGSTGQRDEIPFNSRENQTAWCRGIILLQKHILDNCYESLCIISGRFSEATKLTLSANFVLPYIKRMNVNTFILSKTVSFWEEYWKSIIWALDKRTGCWRNRLMLWLRINLILNSDFLKIDYVSGESPIKESRDVTYYLPQTWILNFVCMGWIFYGWVYMSRRTMEGFKKHTYWVIIDGYEFPFME